MRDTEPRVLDELVGPAREDLRSAASRLGARLLLEEIDALSQGSNP